MKPFFAKFLSFFEKNLVCEIHGPDDKTKKVKVSKKQFNQWKAEGNIHEADCCQVHILGVVVPYNVVTWIIGDNVNQETYDHFKDKNGYLYAISFFEEGKPKTRVIKKELWDKHRSDTLPLPQPETMEECLNYYHKRLLSLDAEAQTRASIAIQTLWFAFNDSYPDIDVFRKAPEAEKVGYLKKISEVVSKLATDEMMDNVNSYGGGVGAALVQLYLVAIAENNAMLINRIADVLEPFNMLGRK